MHTITKFTARAGAALAAVLIPLAAAAPSFAAAGTSTSAAAPDAARHAVSAQEEWITIESNSVLRDGNGTRRNVTTAADPVDVACFITDPSWGSGTWYFLYEVDDPTFTVLNAWTAAENFQVQPQVPAC